MQPTRPEGATDATSTPGRGNICKPHALKGQHMQPARTDPSAQYTTHVHLSSFVKMLHKYLKASTFSSYFWSIIIFTVNGCLEILFTFVFSTFNIYIYIYIYIYCMASHPGTGLSYLVPLF
jgi:hypothetical protein